MEVPLRRADLLWPRLGPVGLKASLRVARRHWRRGTGRKGCVACAVAVVGGRSATCMHTTLTRFSPPWGEGEGGMTLDCMTLD
jgi:hypothetical protein